jgi:hypothetical protein
LIIIIGWVLSFLASRIIGAKETATTAESWTVYDADPNHIWNRLHRALYRRETETVVNTVDDELDPLLWVTTKYLLNDPANRQALTSWMSFFRRTAKRRSTIPETSNATKETLGHLRLDTLTVSTVCKRQRESRISNRLVQAIKRLALSQQQIASLPNTYKQAIDARAFAKAYDSDKREQSFLPPDLFDPKGPWVALSIRGGDLVAPDMPGFFRVDPSS